MNRETAENVTTHPAAEHGVQEAASAVERPNALPSLSVEFATEAMARHYRAAWLECIANVPLRQLHGVSPWRAVRRGRTGEVRRALGAVGFDAAEVSDVLGYCAQVWSFAGFRREGGQRSPVARSPQGFFRSRTLRHVEEKDPRATTRRASSCRPQQKDPRNSRQVRGAAPSRGSGGPGGLEAACGRGGLVTLPHAPVERVRCEPSPRLLKPRPSLGGLSPIEAAVGGGRHELALLARLATDPPRGPGGRVTPGGLVRWLREPTPACGGMSPLQVCAASRRARASRRLAPGGALAHWLPAAVGHDEEALALVDAVVAGRRRRGPAPADGRALVVSCARMWLMAADALGRGAAVAAACELAVAGVSGLKRDPDEVALRHGAHARQVALAVRMLREVLALEPFDVRFAVLP